MPGVYVGAVSGGLFSAIMRNIPGTLNAAATTLDRYPLPYIIYQIKVSFPHSFITASVK